MIGLALITLLFVVSRLRFPDTLTFRAKRTKYLLYLLGSIAFIAATIFLVIVGRVGKLFGIFSLCFWGAGVAISTVHLFPKFTPTLRLDRNGFTESGINGPKFIRWVDVTNFEVGEKGAIVNPFASAGCLIIGLLIQGVDNPKGGKVVVFNFNPSCPYPKTARRVVGSLFGYEGALADTYGMKPKQMAKIMNRWKQRAMIASSGTG